MNLEIDDAVTVEKPVSQDQSIARTWLLPSLVEVLEKNRNREYPQNIFEVGMVLTAKGETRTKVSAVMAHSRTNYSEIKAKVNGLLKEFALDMGDQPMEHPSFIFGRCSKNAHGFFGEVHPGVLSNHGLEVPVTAFELELF